MLAIPRTCMLAPQPAALCSCWFHATPTNTKGLRQDGSCPSDLDSSDVLVTTLLTDNGQQGPICQLAGIDKTKLPRMQLASALLCNMRGIRHHQDLQQQQSGRTESSQGKASGTAPTLQATTIARRACSSYETEACMQPELFAAYSACLPSLTELHFMPLLWPGQVRPCITLQMSLHRAIQPEADVFSLSEACTV